MDKQSLINMLSIGENCEIEFKESKKNLPKSIWNTYSAFANSHGGVIILGIKEEKDKFIIEGVENPTNVLKDFWNTINNKNKININVLENEDVKILKIEGKDIIVITVPNLNRTLKPIYLNKNPMTGTYKRNYEGDYLCTEREVKTLITESAINTKDTLIVENMDMRNINMETLESYRNRFRVHKGKDHEWNNLNDLDFLKMIGAIDRNTEKLTVAGLLVFGNEEDIVKVTTNYFLDYRETLEPELNERWSHRITSWEDTWSGNLFDFYYKISGRLISDIEVPFKLDKNMTRIEDTEIHECVREALVNTLIHSQYFQSGSVVIEKGIDYFVFSNPGSMRVPFDRAKKGGESDPRNRLIHKIFSLVGLGERAGSGIYKITQAWNRKVWKEPEITELFNPDRTILKLEMKKKKNVIENVVESVIENVTENLNKQQKSILEIILKEPKATQKQIAEQIGITSRQVARILKQLKERKVIERIGSDRNGYWKISIND